MMVQTLLMVALLLVALFLILLILVQRGRGGGLAGALGGAGGSSAFGAKAGDNFTWFTIWAASAWIVLCVAAAAWSKYGLTDKLGADDPAAAQLDTGTDQGAVADESAVDDDADSGAAAGDEAPAE